MKFKYQYVHDLFLNFGTQKQVGTTPAWSLKWKLSAPTTPPGRGSRAQPAGWLGLHASLGAQGRQMVADILQPQRAGTGCRGSNCRQLAMAVVRVPIGRLIVSGLRVGRVKSQQVTDPECALGRPRRRGYRFLTPPFNMREDGLVAAVRQCDFPLVLVLSLVWMKVASIA